MKTAMWWGVLGIVAAVAGVGCESKPTTHMAREDKLTKKLLSDSGRDALDEVLKSPDSYSAMVLFFAAQAAHKEKRMEDCIFLFHAGKLRANFDKACFPPMGNGGDNPFFVIYPALAEPDRYQLITPAQKADPQAFQRAIARLKAWKPKAPETYHPYEHLPRMTEADALAAFEPRLAEHVRIMGEFTLTLNDPSMAMEVLKAPEERSASLLFGASGMAFLDNRLEDSAFLHYAGQQRARFDQVCFPPQGQAENNPIITYMMIAKTNGNHIHPAIAMQPKLYEKALTRLKAWSPRASQDYTPGYEFTQRKTQEEATLAAKANREDFIKHMDGFCTLLNDEEYFAAYKVVRARYTPVIDYRPTEETATQAEQTMKRIEKAKGIKGPMSVFN